MRLPVGPKIEVRFEPADHARLADYARRHGLLHGGNPNLSETVRRLTLASLNQAQEGADMTDAITLDIDLIRDHLPDGAHFKLLIGVDVVTGEDLMYPVVWADRAEDRCSRCDQQIRRVVECPVLLNVGAGQGGRVEEISQQHGCGEWLHVDWQQLPEDASEADIVAAANDLAD